MARCSIPGIPGIAFCLCVAINTNETLATSWYSFRPKMMRVSHFTRVIASPFTKRSFSIALPSVIVEKKGFVTTIIINRPDVKNAIDFECAELLAQAVTNFENDETARVAVLCGTDTFCSGADLRAISTGKFNRLENDGNAPLGPSRFQLSKPVVAAVSGHAVAGGMELALLCDMRVMEEDAIFGVFCRRWGVPLIDGGSVRLPRLIGLSRAMDLILTGRPVDASEALHIGLANRVVPKGEARKAAQLLAEQIASFPQECMLADRKSAYQQHSLSIPEALKQEFVGGKPIAQHKLMDGINRFLSKEYKKEQ
jgi:enoyl-CoA hydratase